MRIQRSEVHHPSAGDKNDGLFRLTLIGRALEHQRNKDGILFRRDKFYYRD